MVWPARSARPSALRRYGLAVLVSALAVVLTGLFLPFMQSHLFLFFFAALAISAWYGGLGPGLLTTLLAVIATNYFFLPPVASWTVRGDDLLRLGIFGLIAFLISSLNEVGWRATAEHARLLADEQAARAQAEAARAQLATILESITDGFIALDQQWRLTYLNHEGAWSFGYPPETLLGQVVWSAVPELRETAFGALIQRAASERQAQYDEVFYPALEVWFSVRAYPADSGVAVYFRNITTRKQIEVEHAQLLLREQQAREVAQVERERLYGLFMRTPAGISILRGPRLIYELANEPYQRILGHRNLIGTSLYDAVPDAAPDILQVVEGVYATGERFVATELPIVLDWDATGQRYERYFNLILDATHSLDGAIDGLITFVYEVTDQVRARQQVELLVQQKDESLALLDSLLRNAPIGFAFFDQQHRYVRINEYLAAINGIPVAEHVGKTVRELLPVNAQTVDPIIDQVIATGAAVLDLEVTGETPAEPGVTRHWLAGFYPVQTPQGLVHYVGTVVLEITERKRAEAMQQQLRHAAEASKQQFAFLAEASQLLNTSLDYEDKLTSLAQLLVPYLADYCLLYTLAPDAAYHQVAVAHVDAAKVPLLHELGQRYRVDPKHPQSALAQVLRSGKSLLEPVATLAQATAITDDPQLLTIYQQLQPVSYMVVPLAMGPYTYGALLLATAESGRSYGPDELAFAEEVARRAATALDNARLYREAQAAIQQRDQFFSIAAHELKTPLTALLGNAQLLERRLARDGAASERDRRTAGVIAAQGQRLNQLILTLLDITRIEHGQLSIVREPLDLGALVRRVVAELQPLLEQHSINLDAPSEPLLVAGDELRLEQVFQNLLQNAVKYSPPGSPVQIQVAQRNGQILVSVTDAGVGISPDVLPQLFQRFFRAPNVAPSISGLGIGLYVVKEIVTLHGGTVDVASREGSGSTFTVCLPRLGL
jgi:PAS domain S-box-containing protein